MTDARWFEVDADIAAAVSHFEKSVALHAQGGFDDPSLDGYRASMALMHALQSAHTSLESGLVRILEILGEEAPVGRNWHADIIRRAATELSGRRNAILSREISDAAHMTRRFRHRATHNYDSFDIHEIAPTIEAARTLVSGLESDIAAFKADMESR